MKKVGKVEKVEKKVEIVEITGITGHEVKGAVTNRQIIWILEAKGQFSEAGGTGGGV